MSSLSLGICVPDPELDGPFEGSLLIAFQPCPWSETFLAFYTFPTWRFSGLRAAYDGSIICDCLCSATLKSCVDETPYAHLHAFVLTDVRDEPLAA